MKKFFMIVVVSIVILFVIFKVEEINKNNTYNLKIYSNSNNEWASAYANEEIYTEKYWDLIVNLYSYEISNEYITLSEKLEWQDSGELPEGEADEVVSVSKGSLGLVVWKAWINKDTNKVVLYRYPNMMNKIDLDLYESLPRRKTY